MSFEPGSELSVIASGAPGQSPTKESWLQDVWKGRNWIANINQVFTWNCRSACRPRVRKGRARAGHAPQSSASRRSGQMFAARPLRAADCRLRLCGFVRRTAAGQLLFNYSKIFAMANQLSESPDRPQVAAADADAEIWDSAQGAKGRAIDSHSKYS